MAALDRSGGRGGARPRRDRLGREVGRPRTDRGPAGQRRHHDHGRHHRSRQGSGDGPRNLLANASFEDGSQGWRPIGNARLTRSTEATAGDWSLRILPDPSNDGPVGITIPDATLTKVQGRYHTNAWVRPSAPGATVTIGLREYRDGQPVPGSNTLGWTVERAGWRQFGAIHVARMNGSRLVLEIMARDLPPGGYLDVDEVVLHLLRSRS